MKSLPWILSVLVLSVSAAAEEGLAPWGVGEHLDAGDLV